MLGAIANTIIFALSFALVLSFLVFFHELGHYSVARFFKTSVEKFSIGFGKPIIQWRAKTGTLWSISRIPLGGYVKFAGDAGAASNPDTEQLEKLRSEMAANPDAPHPDTIFHFKPVWQRMLIVLAGPIANFILAVIIFSGLGLWLGDAYYPSVVGSVTEGAPAAEAGFKPGDRILTINGQDATRFEVVQRRIALSTNTSVNFIVDREGVETPITVTPVRQDRKDFVGGRSSVGTIGLGLSRDVQPVRTRLGPLESISFGTQKLGESLSMTGRYLGRIFTGKENGKELGSVVKIATITGKTAVDTANMDVPLSAKIKMMTIRLLSLGASISIALGVANLMPIPVLDGGHLVYYGYEAVAGRPLSQKKQEFGFRLGMAVLLALFVILTFNDIGYVGSLFS